MNPLEKHIDKNEYPFTSRYIDLDAGKMHYVDEGEGDVILMIHGTPTWSFLYRKQIKEFSKTHRVIAPDNLGFGLSGHPKNWAYTPEAHGKNVSEFVSKMGLTKFTLVVHDFGGPIGLSHAVHHPETVEKLVIFNTWMWSLAERPDILRVSNAFGGYLGKLAYTYLNLSPKYLLKALMGKNVNLTKDLHKQYLFPFPTVDSRYSLWVFARELIGSTKWYNSLWEKRQEIQDKPTLLFWGMKDTAFTEKDLRTWESVFTDSTTVELEEGGHYVQEEGGEIMNNAIRQLLEK